MIKFAVVTATFEVDLNKYKSIEDAFDAYGDEESKVIGIYNTIQENS